MCDSRRTHGRRPVPACATRIDGKHITVPPRLLVFQLAAEFTSALIEHRFAETRFGFDTSSWRLNRTCC
ncbi:hypothetical protein [Nitrosomonas cryotolerans]|uniref:hypothetical protein n=1 Tax=Nitrosomonas cryotolerans TaxID=44575 RepID=UPI000A55C136|nr:hypothetical protein [Nitrosomonas cryotolerans]